MAQKPETKITNAIIASIAERQGDAFHVHGSMFQRKGEPDICGEILYNGRIYHLKVEVKTPAKSSKPDPLQIYRLQTYHRWDYVVGVVRSVQDFDTLLYLHHVYLKTEQMMGFKEYWIQAGYADPDNLYYASYRWGERLYK